MHEDVAVTLAKSAVFVAKSSVDGGKNIEAIVAVCGGIVTGTASNGLGSEEISTVETDSYRL